MKVKKITKCMVTGFALAFVTAAALPGVQVSAAESSAKAVVIQTKYIKEDDVPLRAEGWDGGAVLEKMDKGDEIKFYPDIYGSDTEYNYMQRKGTGVYGYVDHHYTSFSK